VVNFDAGAQTPAAGMFTAVGLAGATLLLTPALYYLPQATLAATIVVAVLSLVDLGILRRTWAYSTRRLHLPWLPHWWPHCCWAWRPGW
jgi:SulP family sulfate permease